MDRASSKFVDALAVRKLLNEKLLKVTHTPKQLSFCRQEKPFDALGKYSIHINDVKFRKERSCFELSSFIKTPLYRENEKVLLHYYPSENPIGNILFLHGLYDENIHNYAFLTRMLNIRGLNVFLMVLPYHFGRRPQESIFGGEFFISADMQRTYGAFRQSVFDVETCFQFISHFSNLPCVLAGFSMGGCIAFRYYILKNNFPGVFLINPVTDLFTLVWRNPLMVAVRRDLKACGYGKRETSLVFRDLDPYKNICSNVNLGGVSVVYSEYDKIIGEEENRKFIKRITRKGVCNILKYHAGHLNILRVPKLSKDICDFFTRCICGSKL